MARNISWSRALGGRRAVVEDGPAARGASDDWKTASRVRVDVIGAFEGYQYEVLRTTCVGEPSGEVLKILEICAEATEAAVAACRPGGKSDDIYQTSQAVVERAG